MGCLIEQGDINRECRHRRNIKFCRIGEASHPGPGLDNKQQHQLKLGDFFCRNRIHMDSKSEWCKALSFKIENVRGHGNCLYPSLGKTLEMNGNQVRDSIVDKSKMHWSDIFDFDLDGEEYINFLGETADRKQRG
eukprot:7145460-Heterocapsa_arctica.AAC.1